MIASDVDALRLAAALYSEKIGDRHAGNPTLPPILLIEGMSRLQIFRLTGDKTELRKATEALKRAYDDSPELSLGAAEMAIALGLAYEVQGDLRRARDMGDVAVRTSAYHVLTQSSTRDAMAAVRGGAGYALLIARWCLRDGDPLAAWQAVETGRGLVLHAATVTASVPELLEKVGHADLAAEWRAATRDTSFDARPEADDWRRGTPQLPPASAACPVRAARRSRPFRATLRRCGT